jgi:hypothetical protein
MAGLRLYCRVEKQHRFQGLVQGESGPLHQRVVCRRATVVLARLTQRLRPTRVDALKDPAGKPVSRIPHQSNSKLADHDRKSIGANTSQHHDPA